MKQSKMEKLGCDMDGIRIDSGVPTETDSIISAPADAETAMEVDVDTLFELRITRDKGYGLFATKDIKRGTCIISELPLFILSVEANNIPQYRALHTLEALEKLSREDYDTYSSLHALPHVLDPAQRAAIRAYLKGKQYAGDNLAFATEDLVRLVAIFNSNSVCLGPGGTLGSGVFPTYSRCNHSCSPNAEHHFNLDTGCQNLHAVREIKEGEEIAVSYISDLHLPPHARAELLSEWQVDCACEACDGPGALDSARRRRRMSKIAVWLDDIVQGSPPTTNGQTANFSSNRYRTGLALAQELVKLCREEKLEALHLIRAYRFCSAIALDAGKLMAAIDYARQELEVEIICFGEGYETVDCATDWLAHLQELVDSGEPRFRAERMKIQKREENERKQAEKAKAKEAKRLASDDAPRKAKEAREAEALRARENARVQALKDEAEAAVRAERQKEKAAVRNAAKKAKRIIRAVVKGDEQKRVSVEMMIENMSHDELLTLAEKLHGGEGLMDLIAVLRNEGKRLVEDGKLEGSWIAALS